MFTNHQAHSDALHTLYTSNSDFSVNRHLREVNRIDILTDEYGYDRNQLNDNFFIWSRHVQRKKDLNVELLRLTIQLLYSGFSDEDKKPLFLISYWLIFKKRVTKPFKIMNNKTKGKIISVWCMYQFILKGTPIKAIDEETAPDPYECLLCCENSITTSAVCENCTSRSGSIICSDCYHKLTSPHICPFCSTPTLSLPNTEILERSITFTHNRQNFQKQVSLGSGFKIVWLYGSEIRSSIVRLETLGEYCVDAVTHYLNDETCESLAEKVYPYICEDYDIFFPEQYVLGNHLHSFPVEHQTDMLVKLCGFDQPLRAFDFYRTKVNLLFPYELPSHNNSFVERIEMSNNHQSKIMRIFNENIVNLFNPPTADMRLHPYDAAQSFYDITE